MARGAGSGGALSIRFGVAETTPMVRRPGRPSRCGWQRRRQPPDDRSESALIRHIACDIGLLHHIACDIGKNAISLGTDVACDVRGHIPWYRFG